MCYGFNMLQNFNEIESDLSTVNTIKHKHKCIATLKALILQL